MGFIELELVPLMGKSLDWLTIVGFRRSFDRAMEELQRT
jgi:hypothetical protein